MIEVLQRVSTGTTIRILFPTDPVKILYPVKIQKKTVTMAAKTGELTAYGARKKEPPKFRWECEM